MAEKWLLDVTDLKQYVCCPRLIYYRYQLPDIRPLTYSMQAGTEGHLQEDEREIRRSLKRYGVEDGERLLHYEVRSDTLGLKGKVDLVVIVPGQSAPQEEVLVVEYKHSEQKAGAHFKLQLTAYALLVEEALQLPVRRGFIYSIPLRSAEEVLFTNAQRKKVHMTISAIQQFWEHEGMPPPTSAQARCPTCEFRRFCNDVV